MKVKKGIASSVSLLHDAEHTLRQRLEEVGVEEPRLRHADVAEQQARGREAEGDRECR